MTVMSRGYTKSTVDCKTGSDVTEMTVPSADGNCEEDEDILRGAK